MDTAALCNTDKTYRGSEQCVSHIYCASGFKKKRENTIITYKNCDTTTLKKKIQLLKGIWLISYTCRARIENTLKQTLLK